MATSIHDLPTDGSTGGSISMQITEDSNPQQSSQIALDENTISQIVSGIQKASMSGSTMLQSRDIPMYSQNNDEQAIDVNYIPKSNTTNFVTEYDDDIQEYYKKEQSNKTLDSLYDEMQGPFLLGVLYFLFQLPFLKNFLFIYFPFFCHKDGAYNLNGLLFTCSLFGLIYYSLTRFVKSFSKF
jgi:hypothetical protein